MKLFDRLRKWIVNKLIKPEDGYVYIGFYHDMPIKFVQQFENDKYLLAVKKNDMWSYSEPSLPTGGWKRLESYSDVHDVNFDKWIMGILDNMYSQYYERLEKITLREIKQFNKKNNGEKIVINKQSFCNIMRTLDEYWNNLRELEQIMNVIFEDNMLTQIYDSVVEALVDDMEPYLDFGEDPVIMRWLSEFDCGRDVKAEEGIDGYSLTTAEELYDYLTWKKSLSETLDKFENV